MVHSVEDRILMKFLQIQKLLCNSLLENFLAKVGSE